MAFLLQPHCLSHQKPKASSRQQHESAKKENPKSLPTLRGLESLAKIFAPSSRRGSFSLDSPLYRTRLEAVIAVTIVVLPDQALCRATEFFDGARPLDADRFVQHVDMQFFAGLEFEGFANLLGDYDLEL